MSDKKLGVDNNSDGIIDYYNADVITATDYYPFGQEMPGRKYSQPNTKYRYGFNGQMKDNDISSGGDHYTAEFWEYDSRTGRRWNIEPLTKKFPWLSPYSTFENNPISKNDPTGAKPDDIIIKGSNNSSLTIKTKLVNGTLNLNNYGIRKDFGGQKSISLGDLKPDAIGIDIGAGFSTPLGGKQGGVNFIWHTRGEKNGDYKYPEIHTYAGNQITATGDVSANGNVGLLFAWATKADGTHASDNFVGNGYNYTGNFWSGSVSLGEGATAGGGSYFTSRDLSKPITGEAWSGISVGWTPGASTTAGIGKLGTVLNKINSGTLGLSLAKTYYWMMYGNGSDFLPKSGKDVSGWHLLNPVDPKDDK